MPKRVEEVRFTIERVFCMVVGGEVGDVVELMLSSLGEGV